MLRINNLKLPIDYNNEELEKSICKALRVNPTNIQEIQTVKRSIDARNKSDIKIVLALNIILNIDEHKVLNRIANKNVVKLPNLEYHFPIIQRKSKYKPVIVGMGPAGLFAALYLAQNGIPSIIIERGEDVDSRIKSVEHFWKTGELNTSSNVQFGEGGAGTFSDGKLTTGTHDSRIKTVLETLVNAGAPADVAYSFKPHIGTDILRNVVKNIRQKLISLGCEIRFNHCLCNINSELGSLKSIEVQDVQNSENRYTIKTDSLILAIGHSARDTFEMLYNSGIEIEQKAFAIGVRIEHLQKNISNSQYGDYWDKLPPSDYKLSCHLDNGRSAYSFCVCPGGQVVASASEKDCLVTNGMSLRARDNTNINGGFLVGVTPSDFENSHPLAGMYFQRKWEHMAYITGGNNFYAPAQLVGDFLNNRPSTTHSDVIPSYKPGVKWTNINNCLPDYVSDTLRTALPIFDRKVKGYADSSAVLIGIETRSSSPIKIPRNELYQSNISGIYPCGEGCGYAGGIVSAAVDGIRIAEAVATYG